MSTPNTVKAQLQNLIDISNRTTGKSDTDLTGAVNTLINERESLLDGSITEIYSEVTSFNHDYALAYLSNMKKASFPFLSEIGINAFRYCRSLTNVFVPLVTSVAKEAFYYCDKLKYIDLPKLTGIGTDAFIYASLLDTVILRNTNIMVSLSNSNVFRRTLIESGTGYIYVPRAFLSDEDETKDYRRATNWVTFASQFRALEDYTVDGTIDGELDWDKVNGGTA